MSKLSKTITENEANLMNAILAMTSEEADHFAKLIRHDSEHFKYYQFFMGVWKPKVVKNGITRKKTEE